MATQVEIFEGQKSGSTIKYYFEPDFPSSVAPRSQMASGVNVSVTKYAKSVGIKGVVGGKLKRTSSSFPDRTSCSFGLYYNSSGSRYSVYCADFANDTNTVSYLMTGTSKNAYFLAVPSANYNFWRFEYADGTAVTKSSATTAQAASNVYNVFTPGDSSTLGGRRYGRLMFGYNRKEDDEILAVFSHTLRLSFIDDTGSLMTLCKDDLSAARQLYVAEETELSDLTSESPSQSGMDINYIPQIGWTTPRGNKLVGYKVKRYYNYTPDIIASEALATITDANATTADIDDALTGAGIAFTRDVTSKNVDDWGYYRDVVLEGIYEVQRNVSVSVDGAYGEQTAPSASADSSVAFSGSTVTLTAQTDNLATCEFYGWSATAGGNTVTVIEVSPGVATFTMPDADVSCVATYVPKKFSVSVDSGDGGIASLLVSTDGGTTWRAPSQDGSDFVYGVKLKFSATPTSGTNHTFSGWYDAGGARVSTSADYIKDLTGDTALTARFSAPVDFSVTSGDGYGGYIVVNGVERAESVFRETFEIGATVSVRAVATSGYFANWTKDGVLLPIGEEGTVTVEAETAPQSGTATPASYVAVFASASPQYIVGTKSENTDAGDEADNGYMVLSGANVEELDAELYQDCDHVYRVTGSAPVTYTVYKTGTKEFKSVDWRPESPTPVGEPIELQPEQSGGADASIAPGSIARTGTKAFYRDMIGVAKFGSSSATKVTAISSDAANGTVSVSGGANASGDGSNASADFNVGETVTLQAAPANGYLFGGWYANGVKVDDKAVYSFVFGDSPTQYEARFVQDTDALFLWEGSDENKTMEWTSKVHVAPRPFDPVAARVDAAGYPVDLTVRTYSSPDVTEPLDVRDHELTRDNPTPVQSQDGRRLPRMRPERYVRFTVKSTHEIDAVTIGTNMTEVN